MFVVGQVAGTKVAIYERNYATARAKALLWTEAWCSSPSGVGLSGVDHDHGDAAMSDANSKTPRPPKPPPPATAQTAAPRPAMKVNERLIGWAVIGGGAPKRG